MYTYFLLEELPTTIVVVGLPNAPAYMGIRVRPGLGPNSHHIRLLNATLPAPFVPPTVTAGTLPFMGVS